MNVTEKLISRHLEKDGDVDQDELRLKIDQTLTQDATGTLVILEFESMGIPRVRTELSAQYVDHNLLQEDSRNPDDHQFLLDSCRKFGLWFSPAGNGVSHPLHMERFGIPGKTLLGSDSHTPAAGALGMLAMGSGGLDVALAMAGERYRFPKPEIWGVELKGELPEWVSAKDVVLEMLRRHDVNGGVGKIIEYFGPGLKHLTAMDRHVIANMGTELGATSTVFPSDQQTRNFLAEQDREDDWSELIADDDADYDHNEEINLSELEPLIACPSSPGNVVPVTEVAGEDIYQAYIGSSANPGFSDFSIVARMVQGRRVPPGVSFDINPTSRQILENLAAEGYIGLLLHAGARIHQAGCNGCIGMGQAPATGRNSLRTTPRNFPGRSGAREDSVYLCSPETAAASALTGKITDPRTMKMYYPGRPEPTKHRLNKDMFVSPAGEDEAKSLEVRRGPNIKPIPDFSELPDTLKGPVLLKVGDDISTDEILPAGSKVLPFRSNIEAISEFAFSQIDETFHDRAREIDGESFVVVAGSNYGQGSSREHAALAPRYLGLQAVLAESYARIHLQNLVNFGVVPLELEREELEFLDRDDTIEISNLRKSIESGDDSVTVRNKTKDRKFEAELSLSNHNRKVLLAGGIINWKRDER